MFFIGFGVKIPIWPFHYWLTKVHVEAPTGFSIFLSGFLVKTALYCFIVSYTFFKSEFITYIILTWVLWGSLDASIRMWSSTDIKRLIAFATIQEMNLILSFYLILPNTSYTFVNIFLIMHGILSGLMFFIVDQVQKRFQTRNLIALGGLSVKNTFLTIIIWFMILIFRGFPIFIKFLIEWELLTILFENFSIVGVIVFLFIATFGVLGFCRIWFIVIYGQPTGIANKSTDILKSDLIIASIFIVLLLLLNFFTMFFKVCFTFNLRKKKDIRHYFKVLILNKKKIKTLVSVLDLTIVYGWNLKKLKFYKTNTKYNVHHFLMKGQNYLHFLLLKNTLNNLFFFKDLTFLTKTKQLIYCYSCFLTGSKLSVFKKSKKNVVSLSNIFFSQNWFEREISECNLIFFINLKDNRKLLTDYGYRNDHNSLSYSQYNGVLNEYFKGLLRWLFLFLFLILSILTTLWIYRRSLFHLIILSEVVIILLTLVLTILMLKLNLYYLVGFSLIILIFGGLELALNLLILVL